MYNEFFVFVAREHTHTPTIEKTSEDINVSLNANKMRLSAKKKHLMLVTHFPHFYKILILSTTVSLPEVIFMFYDLSLLFEPDEISFN